MGSLALFDEVQKRWLDFDKDSELCIRYLDKEAALELHKKVDKITQRTGSDRAIIWNQQLGEACLFGWRKKADHDHSGLTTPNGVQIPFSAENRDMLMKRCREVSLFVNENSVDAAVFLELQEEEAAGEETKND